MARPVDYLAGIGYASIFGFSFLVTKDALEVLDPFELLFLRFALAALIMGTLVLLRLVRVDYRGKRSRYLALACLFQPLLYFPLEVFGVRESASSTAGLVLGALPAVGALLGVLALREPLKTLQALFLLLSVAGVGFIALGTGEGGGNSGSPLGFAFLFGAVASAACYNIFSRKSSETFAPAETTFAMMCAGALVFGTVTLCRTGLGLARGDFPGLGAAFLDLARRALGVAPGILYLGALASVLAFFFINFTLSRLRVSQSIVFANLTTVIAVTAGVAIRGETFGLSQLIGSAAIVAGVWGTNAFAGRPSIPARAD